jgi:hypothetical protein
MEPEIREFREHLKMSRLSLSWVAMRCWGQGDQIGQIFASCIIVYFGQIYFKITEVAQKRGLPFSTVKIMY